jgi:hypothetical protein
MIEIATESEIAKTLSPFPLDNNFVLALLKNKLALFPALIISISFCLLGVFIKADLNPAPLGARVMPIGNKPKIKEKAF